MEKPRIGDTIQITSGICSGTRYVVVETPPNANPKLLWCVEERCSDKNDVDAAGYFNADVKYKIVKRGQAQEDVDVKLNKQRDDNLRSVFT